MRSASIGSPAASRSPIFSARGRAGFTLIEALVALAVLLAFAATLGPFLFQARRVMQNSEGRLAAQVLLRAVLEAPFDRSKMSEALRQGETGGLRWRVVVRPISLDVLTPRPVSQPRRPDAGPPPERPNWAAYRVMASVSWGSNQVLTAETVRLGRRE